MKLFRELLLSEVGRPALIVGGSDTAPDDIEMALSAYDNSVVIGVNQHANIHLHEDDVDFLVCYDNIHGILEDAKKKHGVRRWGKIVTYHPFADYKLLEYPVWPGSGYLAVWIAYNLGCCPIVLAGMGCYSTPGRTYFHDHAAVSDGSRIPPEEHVKHWRRLRDAMGSAHIRSTSGPLLDVFPKLDPKEDFSGYAIPDRLELLKMQTGKIVKITHPQGARVGAEHFEPETIVELPRKDAAYLFERRRAVPAQPLD